MPSNSLGNSARRSNRSEEMRILADDMQDLGAKAMMLQLAADRERLAEFADEEGALRRSRRAISPRATKAIDSAD
jgi:hypothetical protein